MGSINQIHICCEAWSISWRIIPRSSWSRATRVVPWLDRWWFFGQATWPREVEQRFKEVIFCGEVPFGEFIYRIYKAAIMMKSHLCSSAFCIQVLSDSTFMYYTCLKWPAKWSRGGFTEWEPWYTMMLSKPAKCVGQSHQPNMNALRIELSGSMMIHQEDWDGFTICLPWGYPRYPRYPSPKPGEWQIPSRFEGSEWFRWKTSSMKPSRMSMEPSSVIMVINQTCQFLFFSIDIFDYHRQIPWNSECASLRWVCGVRSDAGQLGLEVEFFLGGQPQAPVIFCWFIILNLTVESLIDFRN